MVTDFKVASTGPNPGYAIGPTRPAMKIALVSPYDFTYPGGVVNHITALDREFTRMGHDVRVIAPASRPVSRFGERFIPIGRPWPYPSSGSVARITISLALKSQVKAVLARENFDVIHLHEPLCPTLCTTILGASKAVNIGTFHAAESRGYSQWKLFTATILKRLFPKLDGRIAVSEPARQFINRHFRGDYTVIPNGVDLDHFSPDVLPLEQYDDGKINIVFVGRLEKRKGLNYLLEAYARIRREFPNSRLIVVGPGTRWSRQYVEPAPEGVVFAGYATYIDLPRYYQTAHIVCFPATGRESFGMVLLEAMAVGKPVIASNIPGYASVVTHGAEGLLVPPADAAGFAGAITSLINDERLRQKMGMRGRSKAQAYGWGKIARKVSDYYAMILDPRRVK